MLFLGEPGFVGSSLWGNGCFHDDAHWWHHGQIRRERHGNKVVGEGSTQEIMRIDVDREDAHRILPSV